MRKKTVPNLRTRTTRGPASQEEPGAPVASPQTPATVRRNMIDVSEKHEKSAAKSYLAALKAVDNCDPLSVGYDECQNRLRQAAQNLLMWRESHRQALAGMLPTEGTE